MSDESIIKALLSGDEKKIREARTILYKNLLKEFFQKTCRKYSGLSREDVEETFIDAFLDLVSNIQNEQFEGRSKISTYFSTILNRKCSKKADREKAKGFAHSISLEGVLFNMNLNIPSFLKLTFEQEREQNILKALYQAMEALNDKCRGLLRDFYYDKLSQKELAIKWEYKDENTVKVTLNRCRNKLKDIIGPLLDGLI